MYPSQYNFTSIHFDPNLWSSYNGKPIWYGNTPDRGWQHWKRSASKQQLSCLSWQLVSRTSEGSQEQVTAAADYRCQSYCVWWCMTIDLNQSWQCHCIMNLCALFMIRVFPSLCSRLAWCSRKMLLVPSLRQSTSPLLWCVVKNKMSWYFSLSFIFSHFLE